MKEREATEMKFSWRGRDKRVTCGMSGLMSLERTNSEFGEDVSPVVVQRKRGILSPVNGPGWGEVGEAVKDGWQANEGRRSTSNSDQ